MTDPELDRIVPGGDFYAWRESLRASERALLDKDPDAYRAARERELREERDTDVSA